MSDTTTEAPPARVPIPDKAGKLARLAEIRAHLAPVDELQRERLWLLYELRETDQSSLEDIAVADGSNTGAVRTSISKARKNPPPIPDRYDPAAPQS